MCSAQSLPGSSALRSHGDATSLRIMDISRRAWPNLADARSRERSHSGAGAWEWLWMYPFSLAIVAGVFALAPRHVRRLGLGHRR